MDRDLNSAPHTATFNTQIQALMTEITVLSMREDRLDTAEQLDTLEQQIHALTRQLADHITALKLQQSIDSEGLQNQAKQLIQSPPKKRRNVGRREVNVRFLGGTRLKISVPYYARRWAQKKGQGCYPSLLLLGIHDRCTLALAHTITHKFC